MGITKKLESTLDLPEVISARTRNTSGIISITPSTPVNIMPMPEDTLRSPASTTDLPRDTLSTPASTALTPEDMLMLRDTLTPRDMLMLRDTLTPEDTDKLAKCRDMPNS